MLAPGISVVVSVSVHVDDGVAVGVDDERAVDVLVGDGLEVWVCVDVGLPGVVIGVGVGVDVGMGRVAVSVGVGQSVEVEEGDGEGFGVGDAVAMLCCVWGGTTVGGSAADAR